MPKTPDDVKKGLECCIKSPFRCKDDCPYKEGCDGEQIMVDALAFIQQLEKDKDDLLEERELNDYLRDRVKQLEAERDAAVAELANSDSPCDFCKYLKKFAHETPCNNCVHVLHGEKSQFKWRGVQKEETP